MADEEDGLRIQLVAEQKLREETLRSLGDRKEVERRIAIDVGKLHDRPHERLQAEVIEDARLRLVGGKEPAGLDVERESRVVQTAFDAGEEGDRVARAESNLIGLAGVVEIDRTSRRRVEIQREQP